MNKKKIIIISLISFGVLTISTITPILIFWKKNDDNKEKHLEYLKTKINSISNKIILISATSGSINQNKKEILKVIKSLKNFPSNFKNVLLSIKDDDSLISLKGTPFVLILKEGQNILEINNFVVKRQMNNFEKINSIKEKIKNKNIVLKNINNLKINEDISSKIKKQLKMQNNLLTNEELDKITIDPFQLIPNKKTLVTLKITIKNKFDKIKIYVTRPKNIIELNNDINEVEKLLNTLNPKEITIDALNESITTNKNSILEKIKSLSGYSNLDLNGVIISIKESDDIVSLEGTDFELTLTKNGQSKDVLIFRVKRSKTQIELNQDDVNEIKKSLENLNLKEVNIDESSGSITANKDLIFEKIKALSGYPLDLKGVTISIKESSIIITPLGVDFEITLTKNSQSKDVSIFRVKRNPTLTEINNDINEVKRLLNALNPKEITINESSGSITNHKNSILEKIKALSDYPSDLKGVTVSIKEEDTEITLEGVAFTIELSKGDINQELREFTVKRSQTQIEIDQNDVNEIKNALNALNPKEITINESSSSITTNKNSIIEKIKALSDYPSDLKGVTVSIKEEDTKINLEGVAFTIQLSKGSVNQELREFTVKRSQTQIELNLEKIKEIRDKIKKRDIILNSNIDTSNDSKILDAIRVQLKKDNKNLSDEDLKRIIDDNIETLIPGNITTVTLKIAVGDQTSTIFIFVKKLKNTIKLKSKIKKIKSKIKNKDIVLPTNVDTLKAKEILFLIQSKLRENNNSLNYIDTSAIIGHNISSLIIGEKTTITLTIKIETEKDTIDIFVTRDLPNIQKINKIKDKIKNKDLTLPATTNTRNDEEILDAIKVQLKKDNSNLSDEDLEKIIDDDIIALTPGIKIPVTLTIFIDEIYTININIIRPKNTNELNQDDVNGIKKLLNTLTSKEVTIAATSGSITTNKDSILEKLQVLSGYPSNLKGVSISIKDGETEINLEGVAFTIQLSKGDINQELTKFIVKRSQTQDEIKNDINEVENLLNTLTSKEVTIAATSGSITDNKEAILTKIQALSGYPSDLKGVSISIKESSIIITLLGVDFEITLIKNSQSKDVSIFRVKRSQTQDEIKNDINEVERLLNTLTSKEVTIAAISGSITDNKEAILTQIQTLSGYNELDLNGVIISIKESSNIITPLGINVELTLTKNGQSKDVSIFRVKRSQTQDEIKNDINEVENLLNTLTSKEVTIAATSGSITDNKEAILTKIQALSGYPSDLKGVSISIKESSIIITPLGVDFEITLIKNSQSKDVSIFRVKRSQTQDEIKNDINEVERLLNTLTSKEVTIAATSGTINDNKEAILTQIQTLSGYNELDLNGVIISIKESPTIINPLGINVELTLTKNGQSKDVSIFKVKRSKTQAEIDQNDINEVERLLNTLTSKEVTIAATSGSITDNKEAILEKIKFLSGYNELDLKGITISIKESSNIITPLGINVELTLTKNGQSKDVSIFRVKRSQTQAEIDQNDINEVERLLNTLTSKEVTIAATSGSITDNKEAILEKIKFLSGYSELDLNGVIISIKESPAIINPLGMNVELTLIKNSQSKDVSIFRVKRNQSQDEIKNDINEVERLLNTLTSKEVTIAAISGSITDNKEAILTQIQTLNGYNELDLKEVTISIKESDEIVSLEGTNFELTLTKNGQSKNVSIFRVKKIQTLVEIQNDINEIKNLLERHIPKTITIDEIGGSITNNKNSILAKIQALNFYPSDLKGVSISIKDEDTEINLEGVAIVLQISKGNVRKKVIGFIVKRSKTDIEKIAEIEILLNNLPSNSKEIIIDELSGSITKNKEEILTKIKTLSGYPKNFDGITISIEDDENELTLEGVPIVLLLSKGIFTKKVEIFKAKRAKTEKEINQDILDRKKTKILYDKMNEKTLDKKGLRDLFEDNPKVINAIKNHNVLNLTEEQKNALTHIYGEKEKVGYWTSISIYFKIKFGRIEEKVKIYFWSTYN